MREPVFPGIAGHTLRLGIVRAGAFGGESPNVPSARAISVDVYPLSVGRVIGTIVKAGTRGQPLFFAAGRRNAVNVEISATLSDKGQPTTVGRPAMEVARNIRRDHLRAGAVGVGYIHLRSLRRSMLRRECQPFAIRG